MREGKEGTDGGERVARAELARDGLGGSITDPLEDGPAGAELDVERNHASNITEGTAKTGSQLKCGLTVAFGREDANTLAGIVFVWVIVI